MKYDYVIIGAGLAGCTIANRLANRGYNILIIEKRNHIAGNLYDEYDEEAKIFVQKYGPHTIHTNNERVYNFIKDYANWNSFKLTCGVNMLNKSTPSPFNYRTIEQFFPNDYQNIINEFEKEYPIDKSITIVDLLNSKNNILKHYAEFLFKHDYSLYTSKQWGIKPEQVDVNVLRRVPVRKSYEEGYFDDKYELMPAEGFTKFIYNLIDFKNIKVLLNQDALNLINIESDKILVNYPGCENSCVIYTGSLDSLFSYEYGILPYRSLDFKYQLIHNSKFQDYPVVAYPEADEYTRITDYNQLPIQKSNKTIIAYEYPKKYEINSENEPYYPINNEINNEIYHKYFNKTKLINNLVLCGRLAEYKYYNMDQVILSALELCDKL